jgi:hypothetical protein
LLNDFFSGFTGSCQAGSLIGDDQIYNVVVTALLSENVTTGSVQKLQDPDTEH